MLADGRMLPDRCTFLRSEGTWLQQNRVGHNDFTDIVDNSGAAQSGDVVVGKPDAFAEMRGEFGQARQWPCV